LLRRDGRRTRAFRAAEAVKAAEDAIAERGQSKMEGKERITKKDGVE